MPIYEYRHTEPRGPECEEDVFEDLVLSIKDYEKSKLKVCPKCGKKVERLISVTAVGKVVEEGEYESPEHGKVRLPGNPTLAKGKIRDHIIKTEGEEKADKAEILAPGDYGR